MLLIHGLQIILLVRLGMWIQNSNIDETPLMFAPPETIYSNIHSSIITHIHRSGKRSGVPYRLENWFNRNFITRLSQQ